jgi:hypothetical protein
MNGFLVAITFNGIRRCVQAAKQQAVWLSLDCISGKYLWALPTPTTFKKVDQTFIINWQINLLNNNLFQFFDKKPKAIPPKISEGLLRDYRIFN